MTKRGRKNHWDESIYPRLREVGKWARSGLTDMQIAARLGVSKSTFFKWKAIKTELSDTLKINKYSVDLEVENTLLKRALGYTVTETVEEVYGSPTGEIDKNGKPIIKPDKLHRRTIKKEIIPDVTAQIYWLKNRVPDEWRDRKFSEISGPDGSPIPVSSLDEETYLKIRRRMLEEDDC